METSYVVAGMNVVKCEHCGVDKQGKPLPKGGNVFLSVDLSLYNKIRHRCSVLMEGRCHRCKRKSRAKLIHPAAPIASEPAIGRVVHTFNNLG